MELGIKTAREARHDKLYHYQKFNSERLADLLTRNRIFCATPGKLNDPWDCRPWFDASPLLSDPNELERHLDWLYSNAVPRPPEHERDVYNQRMRTDPSALRDAIANLSRTVHRVIAERRIYCLTPHPDNILMWSHYGDNHRGVCLVFDTGVQLFGTAKEVQYREKYPSVGAHLITPDAVIAAILTKSDVWRYENEFRILGTPHGNGLPIQLDGNYLPIGTALIGIIIGCEADSRAILKFLRGHAPQLPVYRAAREDNQYRLKIVNFLTEEIASHAT